ncbi:MAG: DNA repair protein RecN [Lachnospiraceae bacterium]|nr:DNA repair protein RecN [Lachnospiraceae bacterium]
MLESLHVKNLALIDEQEVTFSPGMNILTGETGAGKSIIIGSINLALGAKADKDYIRTGAEYALVELVFSLNQKQQEEIKKMELPVEEDGTLLLQRKIMAGRSICKVNGESVSSGQLKMLSGSLIDMYGQHEHHSLLKGTKHRELLDDYAGNMVDKYKRQLKELYGAYKKTEEEISLNCKDEITRKREMDLLSFEVNELEAAALTPGEDERLENSYRKMVNARKIKESIFLVHGLTGYEEEGSAGEALGRALRELKNAAGYDEAAQDLAEQLEDIEHLLGDFNRALADYQESLDFDGEEFAQIEERLNIINHLKGKYGNTIEEIQVVLEKKNQRLEQLLNFNDYLDKLESKREEQKHQIIELCKKISSCRVKAAEALSGKLKEALIDLNFIDVVFEIVVEPEPDQFSEDGYDKIEFFISTNPGEMPKPLQQIASGGELSRIMLAFKTVFADQEETETLVFDEIDTGISGKTAWKVSEKLGKLSSDHQVICITHLPQIAAMADAHFLIEKQVRDDRTVTRIEALDQEKSLAELARLLGSGSVTEAVLMNAREMKELAAKTK